MYSEVSAKFLMSFVLFLHSPLLICTALPKVFAFSQCIDDDSSASEASLK